MNKTNHSNEEIQQLLESLLQERKNAKKLQQESLQPNPIKKNQSVLLDPEDPSNLTEQIQKLKDLLAHSKTNYDHTLNSQISVTENQSAEIADLSKQLQEANQKILYLFVQIDRAEITHQTLETQLTQATQKAEIALFEQKKMARDLLLGQEEKEVLKNELSSRLQESINEHAATKEALAKAVQEINTFKIRSLEDEENSASLKKQQETLKEKLLTSQQLNNDQQSELLEINNQVSELKKIEDSYHKAIEQKQALESSLHESFQQIYSLKKEKDQVEHHLADVQLHSEQLEKGMQYLRAKTEESKLEADQLGEELSLSQENLEKMLEEFRCTQDEAEHRQKEFIEKQAQLEETQEELKAVQGQFEQLKSKLIASQQLLNQNSLDFQISQDRIKALQTQCNDFEKASAQKNESLLMIENEIEKLKNALSQALLNSQQFETRYLTLNSSSSQLSEKNNLLHNEIDTLNVENKKLNDSIKHFQTQLQDREAQIKIAQQHLAKKVKDLTILNESAEEQKTQIHELQNHWTHAKEKLVELKHALDSQQGQEKRLQELLIETSKSAELQNQKWEEKYFKLFEKCVEAESANKELKKLEEKYNQMQAVLANLGSVFGMPNPQTQSIHPHPSAPLALTNESLPKTEKENLPPPPQRSHQQQNEFFNHPSPPPPFKRNLFE